jgi:hypothetical protein
MKRLFSASRRTLQRGEMALARIILLVFICLLMLVVPLLLWKDKDHKGKEREAAERAANGGPPASVPAAAAEPVVAARVNDPDRFGLTFGWAAPSTPDRLLASCHGQPQGLARPHQGSCNPYQGDTSCRTELPVLCARDAQGGDGYALGTSRAVAGFLLTGRDDGDARCRADFGNGWRMASFHDGGGWRVEASRLVGTAVDSQRRAWVAIGDQRGNCWDAAP